MIINFDEMEEKIVPNFKGGEKEFIMKAFTNELGKILYGKLEPGATIGYHVHDTSSEIIYMLKGTGTVLTDNGTEIVPAGVVTYCPKGQGHSLRNESDETIEFLGVVPEQ